MRRGRALGIAYPEQTEEPDPASLAYWAYQPERSMYPIQYSFKYCTWTDEGDHTRAGWSSREPKLIRLPRFSWLRLVEC